MVVVATKTKVVDEKILYESLQSYVVDNYDEDQPITMFDGIRKPQDTEKNYRLLLLPNQIKVLLIQDPED